MAEPYVKLTEHAIIRLAERAIGFDLKPYLDRTREAIMRGKIEQCRSGPELVYMVKVEELGIYAVMVKYGSALVVKTFLTHEQLEAQKEEHEERRKAKKVKRPKHERDAYDKILSSTYRAA